MSRVWRGSKPDSDATERMAIKLLRMIKDLTGRYPTQEELDDAGRKAGLLDENGNGVRLVLEDFLPRNEA